MVKLFNGMQMFTELGVGSVPVPAEAAGTKNGEQNYLQGGIHARAEAAGT
jgi:hypothetical protein